MKDNSEEFYVMQVSPGAADLLTSLGENLLILEELVSVLLFPIILEKLSVDLDHLILTDVSLMLESDWTIPNTYFNP